MKQSIIETILDVVAMDRKELEAFSERLVNDFPERAAELEFLMWTQKPAKPVDLI